MISDGKTIGGHAVQNWCLIRLIPLLIFDVVDVSEAARKLLLLLRDIIELVCAPRIFFNQVMFLNRLVKLYVEERMHLFGDVPIRPKHHYLLHYPWLITMFGLLIHVWTLRMESKHTFFKRCARSTHNFVNVTKTLSETHQLNRALLSTGVMLCDLAELGHDCMTFDELVFAKPIVDAVYLCRTLLAPMQCSSSISFKGTLYYKDCYVVIDHTESHPVFAQVVLCLLDHAGNCGLVVKVCSCDRKDSLGVYVVQNSEESDHFTCLPLHQLLDYCPLQGYVINGSAHIAMKHAVLTCGDN